MSFIGDAVGAVAGGVGDIVGKVTGGIGGGAAKAAGATVNDRVTPATFGAPQSGFYATAPQVNPASANASLSGFNATAPTMSPANMTAAQYQAYQAALAQMQRPGWSAQNNFQFQAPTAQAAQAGYQWNAPNINAAQNPYLAQQANLALSNYGNMVGGLGYQALGGMGPTTGTQRQQQALVNQLSNQAQGIGPSIAQQLLQQGQEQNVQRAASLIGAQRGINPGAASRNIMDAMTQANTGTAAQAALLRNQEQLNAQGLLGQTLNQMGGLQLGQQGMGIQGVGTAGGLQNTQNQALIANLMQQQQLNQASAAQNATLQQQAAMANAGYDLTAQQGMAAQALANAGFTQQANLANAGFNLAAQQGNAGIASQNAAFQQAAGLANLQSALQTNLANAGWQNQANAGNAQLQQAANLANAGFQQQSNLQNGAWNLAAQGMNQQTANLNAQLGTQTNLANAGWQQQAGLANASNIMGAQQLNQLTGSQNVNAILNTMGLNSAQILGANNINSQIAMYNAGVLGNAAGGVMGGIAGMIPGMTGAGGGIGGSGGAVTAPSSSLGYDSGAYYGGLLAHGGEIPDDSDQYLTRQEQDVLAQMIAQSQALAQQNNMLAQGPGAPVKAQQQSGGDAGLAKLIPLAMTIGPMLAGAHGGEAKGKLKDNGKVTGKAKIKGDSEKNDTVSAKLSPGEIVLPRSVAQAPNAPQAAAQFVMQLKAGKQGFAGGGEVDYATTLANKLSGGDASRVNQIQQSIQYGLSHHKFADQDVQDLAGLSTDQLASRKGLDPWHYNILGTIAQFAGGSKEYAQPYSITHPSDTRNSQPFYVPRGFGVGSDSGTGLPPGLAPGLGLPTIPQQMGGAPSVAGTNMPSASGFTPVTPGSAGYGISGFYTPGAGQGGGPAPIGVIPGLGAPTMSGGYTSSHSGGSGGGSALGAIGGGIGGSIFGPVGAGIGAIAGGSGILGDIGSGIGNFFGGLFAQGGEVPIGNTKLSDAFVRAIGNKSAGGGYRNVVQSREKAKKAKRAH